VIPPVQTSAPCEACYQATLAIALTQERNTADNQAAATADIVRANSQASLNLVGFTQRAALTKDAIRQTQMADLATKRRLQTGSSQS